MTRRIVNSAKWVSAPLPRTAKETSLSSGSPTGRAISATTARYSSSVQSAAASPVVHRLPQSEVVDTNLVLTIPA
jgi:hypothetical protein